VKGPYQAEYKERAIYSRIKSFMPLRQIIALNGLRRVGKTTLLLKAAADAIADGLDPKDVIYFSFDEFKSIELRDVLRASGGPSGQEFLRKTSSADVGRGPETGGLGEPG